VRATPLTWATRVLWLVLPLTLGELLADALDGRSAAVRATAAVLAWAVWAAGLAASLVASTATLTALRILAPLPLVAGLVGLVAGADPDVAGWIGLAAAVGAAACAMSAEVGEWFVNGSSYGDERRLPLRPPAALLLGPVELAWALTALPLPAGALLLAAGSWVAGGILVAVGAATAWWGARALHRLARRWAVFVPAGITVVDDLALAEPVLFRREAVTRLGPAPADTAATDLTAGAAGLILQLDVVAPLSVVPAAPRRGAVTEPVEVTSVLIAAGRPGALLTHAESRRIAVGRT
jgi:hypothetical protein